MCCSFSLLCRNSGGYRGWREGFLFVPFRALCVSGPASALISQAGQTLSYPNSAGCSIWLIANCQLLIAFLVRDHPPDLVRIGRAHQSVGIEVAFALGRFRGKDMALERFAALDLAGAGFLEAFCRARVGFHFRHKFISRDRIAAWSDFFLGYLSLASPC